MALTPSSMLPLGSVAPTFALPDTVTGNIVSLEDNTEAPAILIAFLCNHCPYVVHIRAGFVQLAQELQAQGVAVIAISSNDVATHPQDGPEQMGAEARKYGYTFPYLYDETQEVARSYAAACTPDFFLFDANKRLVYRGQIDASRPGNGVPVDGSDLNRAVKALMSGNPVDSNQRPSTGCGIKWKK